MSQCDEWYKGRRKDVITIRKTYLKLLKEIEEIADKSIKEDEHKVKELQEQSIADWNDLVRLLDMMELHIIEQNNKINETKENLEKVLRNM